MAAYRDQHFIPKFLLREWCQNSKLTCFRWAHDKFSTFSFTPAEIAYEKDLWSIVDDDLKRNTVVEKRVYGLIDDQGSKVHKILLAGHTPNLHERWNWALFLASLVSRNPQLVKKAIDNSVQHWGVKRPGLDGRLYKAWGVLGSIRSIISDACLEKMVNARWKVLDLSLASEKLLLSDRALIAQEPPSSMLKPAELFIMLPLSPTHLFVAGPEHENTFPFDSGSVDMLARTFNTESVKAAAAEVYAVDIATRQFVHCEFKNRAALRAAMEKRSP